MKRLMDLLTACAALAGLFVMGPAAAEDKPLVVGAIYVESVNDYGYDRAMKDGLEEMKKNIPGLKLIEAENVPETAESERIMEGMIQQGAKLIFATSFGHQQFAFNLAKTHPDVVFEHAGGWMQAPNFGNFFGATQSAWYPMGVAAGKMTKSNTLGFVVGVPIGYALGNVNAFEMGARSVNPNAVTRVVVTGGWSDKAKEAVAANALIDQGADVVTMHVDSPATIIQIAESRGVYSIGFQSTEARALPRVHLGAVHDRHRQERDRGHVQAGDGPAGPWSGDDGGGAVRARRSARCTCACLGIRRPDSGRLQSLHRSDHRQQRRGADQGGRVLGRRQDGEFRLVRRGRDRQGEVIGI